MNKNCTQGDISGPMDARSSTVTSKTHAPLGENVTIKNSQKLTQWEEVNQMLGGNQVNDMSGGI